MPRNEKFFNFSTVWSVAALLLGCVDVDGYQLRNDALLAGGAPPYLPITGGLSFGLTGGRAAIGGSSSQGGTQTTGGSIALVWQCVTVAFNACASASTLNACNLLPGCQYTKVGTCNVHYADFCLVMSDSIAQCASLPGCTSTGEGYCDANDLTASCTDFTSDACGQALDCLQVKNAAMCQGLSCHWTPSFGSCTGTPTPCESFVNSETCATSHNCTWGTTDACVGTPADCSIFTTQTTCNASDNCGWKAVPANTGGTASTATSGAAGLAGMTSSGGLQGTGGS